MLENDPVEVHYLGAETKANNDSPHDTEEHEMRDGTFPPVVADLLDQADATRSEQKAETLVIVAQRLASASAIDDIVARFHKNRTDPLPLVRRSMNVFAFGERGRRQCVELFASIARATMVDTAADRDSRYMDLCGMEFDVDVVERIHAVLLNKMRAASDAYVWSGSYKGRTAPWVVSDFDDSTDQWKDTVVQRPMKPGSARKDFQFAYADRLGELLATAQSKACSDATVRGCDDTVIEMALRAKRVAVSDFSGHSGYPQRSLPGFLYPHWALPYRRTMLAHSDVGQYSVYRAEWSAQDRLETDTRTLIGEEAARDYAANVLSTPAVAARWPRAAIPVRIQSQVPTNRTPTLASSRRALAAYVQGSQPAIHLFRVELCELDLLHEIAHHLDGVHGHGPGFRAALIGLIGVMLGPGAERVYRNEFESAGLI